MNEDYAFIFISCVVLLVLVVVSSPGFMRAPAHYLASLAFPERITPESLQGKYSYHIPLKILIVPGHDDESWGTDYKGLKEAGLTFQVGLELKKLFDADPAFTTTITRDENGYVPIFDSYLFDTPSLIDAFRNKVRSMFLSALKSGEVTVNGVNHHSTASNEDSRKLYGINKWADENNIDIVLHLHFDDYDRWYRTRPGKFVGFSIYVPESQYPNARASRAVAEAVEKELETDEPVSNLPQEQAGVVEDQNLIALGSNASLDAASLLIEYAYIYEPKVADQSKQASVFHEFAWRTYSGVKDFLAKGVENK